MATAPGRLEQKRLLQCGDASAGFRQNGCHTSLTAWASLNSLLDPRGDTSSACTCNIAVHADANAVFSSY